MSSPDDLTFHLPAADVPPGLHDRLLGLFGGGTTFRRLDADIAHDSFAGVPAGLRSVAVSGERSLVITAADIEVVLEVVPADPAEPGEGPGGDGDARPPVRVVGQILTGLEDGEPAAVQLVDDRGQEAFLAVVDERGELQLGPVPSGTYDLVVARATGEVTLEGLQLG